MINGKRVGIKLTAALGSGQALDSIGNGFQLSQLKLNAREFELWTLGRPAVCDS